MGKQEIKIENTNPVSPSQVYLCSSQPNLLIGEEFATWGFGWGKKKKKKYAGNILPWKKNCTHNQFH